MKIDDELSLEAGDYILYYDTAVIKKENGIGHLAAIGHIEEEEWNEIKIRWYQAGLLLEGVPEINYENNVFKKGMAYHYSKQDFINLKSHLNTKIIIKKTLEHDENVILKMKISKILYEECIQSGIFDKLKELGFEVLK
jgi:hypothetical protein